jgi:hypothetical protein
MGDREWRVESEVNKEKPRTKTTELDCPTFCSTSKYGSNIWQSFHIGFLSKIIVSVVGVRKRGKIEIHGSQVKARKEIQDCSLLYLLLAYIIK